MDSSRLGWHGRSPSEAGIRRSPTLRPDYTHPDASKEGGNGRRVEAADRAVAGFFFFFLPQRRHKIAPYRLPAHLKTSVTPRVSGFSKVHDYAAAVMPPETGLHYRSDYFVAW